jgi:hypothetical protein
MLHHLFLRVSNLCGTTIAGWQIVHTSVTEVIIWGIASVGKFPYYMMSVYQNGISAHNCTSKGHVSRKDLLTAIEVNSFVW